MAYPQKLLSDGEHVAFEMRPHWRALVIPGLILLAVVFGLALGFGVLNDAIGGTGALHSISTWVIWLAALFIVIVFAIRPFLYWVTTQYVFTNRRIIVRSGLIARHGRDMPLSKVNNVSFDVSVGGRLLNYGTLTVDSASDEALIINDVPNVEQIQREVNRLHEEDDERRRMLIAEDIAPNIPQPGRQQYPSQQQYPGQHQYPQQGYPQQYPTQQFGNQPQQQPYPTQPQPQYPQQPLQPPAPGPQQPPEQAPPS